MEGSFACEAEPWEQVSMFRPTPPPQAAKVDALRVAVGPWCRVERPAGAPLPPTAAPFSREELHRLRAAATPLPSARRSEPAPAPCGPVSAVERVEAQFGERALPLPPAPPQGRQLELPDAHQVFHCWPRHVYWNPRLPVPEENTGVVITAEYRTIPERFGKEQVFHDEAIRNEGWRHCGALALPAMEAGEEPLSSWLAHHADYGGAVDIKGAHKFEAMEGPPHERHLPDYHGLRRRRDGERDELWRTALGVRENLRREILDERGIRDFFSDPGAVSFERVAA